MTANKYHNSDLFWALRGGGGGTWGIVTSVTVRAFNDPPMVSFSLTGGVPFGDERYWIAVEAFHAFLPTFNDAGGAMYYWLYPDFPKTELGHVSAIYATGAFVNSTSIDVVNKVMEPLVTQLNKITGGNFNYTSTFSKKASDTYVAANQKSEPAGSRLILGSRIVSRDFLKSKEGPERLTSSLRSLRTYPANTVAGQNAIQGLVVAGPAVAANANKVDSALHPVWRKAVVHVVLARSWAADATVSEQEAIQKNLTEVEVPILKALEPNSGGGAYLNEADSYDKDFQDSFWGSNYPRLYQIKQKWDPKNLFIVRAGVGSENWDAEGFCRK